MQRAMAEIRSVALDLQKQQQSNRQEQAASCFPFGKLP